jgi:hypothetical protein
MSIHNYTPGTKFPAPIGTDPAMETNGEPLLASKLVQGGTQYCDTLANLKLVSTKRLLPGNEGIVYGDTLELNGVYRLSNDLTTWTKVSEIVPDLSAKPDLTTGKDPVIYYEGIAVPLDALYFVLPDINQYVAANQADKTWLYPEQWSFADKFIDAGASPGVYNPAYSGMPLHVNFTGLDGVVGGYNGYYTVRLDKLGFPPLTYDDLLVEQDGKQLMSVKHTPFYQMLNGPKPHMIYVPVISDSPEYIQGSNYFSQTQNIKWRRLPEQWDASLQGLDTYIVYYSYFVDGNWWGHPTVKAQDLYVNGVLDPSLHPTNELFFTEDYNILRQLVREEVEKGMAVIRTPSGITKGRYEQKRVEYWENNVNSTLLGEKDGALVNFQIPYIADSYERDYLNRKFGYIDRSIARAQNGISIEYKDATPYVTYDMLYVTAGYQHEVDNSSRLSALDIGLLPGQMRDVATIAGNAISEYYFHKLYVKVNNNRVASGCSFIRLDKLFRGFRWAATGYTVGDITIYLPNGDLCLDMHQSIFYANVFRSKPIIDGFALTSVYMLYDVHLRFIVDVENSPDYASGRTFYHMTENVCYRHLTLYDYWNLSYDQRTAKLFVPHDGYMTTGEHIGLAYSSYNDLWRNFERINQQPEDNIYSIGELIAIPAVLQRAYHTWGPYAWTDIAYPQYGYFKAHQVALNTFENTQNTGIAPNYVLGIRNQQVVVVPAEEVGGAGSSDANLNKGGHHHYATISERDAIPEKLRRAGMSCSVWEGASYRNAAGMLLPRWFILTEPIEAQGAGWRTKQVQAQFFKTTVHTTYSVLDPENYTPLTEMWSDGDYYSFDAEAVGRTPGRFIMSNTENSAYYSSQNPEREYTLEEMQGYVDIIGQHRDTGDQAIIGQQDKMFEALPGYGQVAFYSYFEEAPAQAGEWAEVPYAGNSSGNTGSPGATSGAATGKSMAFIRDNGSMGKSTETVTNSAFTTNSEQATASTLVKRDASGNIYVNDFTITSSDERLKTDVKPLEAGAAMAMVLNMEAVYYRRNDQENPALQIGVLAQQMQQVCPELVHHLEYAGLDDALGVSYERIGPVLVPAVQFLFKALQDVKQELRELKGGANG